MGVWVPTLLYLSPWKPHLIQEMSSLSPLPPGPVSPTLKEEAASFALTQPLEQHPSRRLKTVTPRPNVGERPLDQGPVSERCSPGVWLADQRFPAPPPHAQSRAKSGKRSLHGAHSPSGDPLFPPHCMLLGPGDRHLEAATPYLAGTRRGLWEACSGCGSGPAGSFAMCQGPGI